MNRIDPEHLAEVGKFVAEAAGEAISIGALARQLGVRFPTARRRLEAYAAANGLTLQSGRARVGLRGPEATTWYLRPPAETATPLDPRVRAAFMAAIPRDLEDAVSSDQLLAKVREGLPREVSKRTSSSSFAALLSGAVDGVVTTQDGLVYLEGAEARTQSVAAVERSDTRRQPSPRPSPPRGRGSEVAGETEVVTGTVRAIGEVVDGSDDAALGLSAEVLHALSGDELLALRLLAQNGSARTTELAACVGHSPDRALGMMRELRRTLHSRGADVFVDEILPDGEPMFRFLPPDER